MIGLDQLAGRDAQAQIVDDDAVLAGELVEQRGLAHVRAADEGHPARATDLRLAERRLERVGAGVGRRAPIR